MSKLLAVYDPSGKLGLTDPSPGGAQPALAILYGCTDRQHGLWPTIPGDTRLPPTCGICGAMKRWAFGGALLLVTEDGTLDPIGMARAREGLARVLDMDTDGGVYFAHYRGRVWIIEGADDVHIFAARPTESAPEALARLLSEHAGCEVIRG